MWKWCFNLHRSPARPNVQKWHTRLHWQRFSDGEATCASGRIGRSRLRLTWLGLQSRLDLGAYGGVYSLRRGVDEGGVTNEHEAFPCGVIARWMGREGWHLHWYELGNRTASQPFGDLLTEAWKAVREYTVYIYTYVCL